MKFRRGLRKMHGRSRLTPHGASGLKFLLALFFCVFCLVPYGVCGLKYGIRSRGFREFSLTLYGVCGLKYCGLIVSPHAGEWIGRMVRTGSRHKIPGDSHQDIQEQRTCHYDLLFRRIMFLAVLHIRTRRRDEYFVHFCCLTPYGVCGLKFYDVDGPSRVSESHPVRGVWIEIRRNRPSGPVFRRLTPYGVCGLKKNSRRIHVSLDMCKAAVITFSFR